MKTRGGIAFLLMELGCDDAAQPAAARDPAETKERRQDGGSTPREPDYLESCTLDLVGGLYHWHSGDDLGLEADPEGYAVKLLGGHVR